MKTKVFAFLTSIALIFSLSVSAVTGDFSIDVGKDYIGAYKSSDKQKLAEAIGMSEKETQKYFKDNNIEYFAIKTDATAQLSVSVYNNDLSTLTGDSSELDDASLKKLAQSLSSNEGDSFEIYTSGKSKYIVFNNEIDNSKGKNYFSSQYITVSGGDFYQLTFFSSNNGTNEDIKQIVSSFKINKTEQTPSSIIPILLLILGIAVFTAVSAVMLIGIIKRIKQRKSQREEQGYEPITKE